MGHTEMLLAVAGLDDKAVRERTQKLAEGGRLGRARSRRMEADRAAAGLVGVQFAYYRCACGVDDVYIDVFSVAGDAPGTLGRRLGAMREAARRARADGVETQVLLLGTPA